MGGEETDRLAIRQTEKRQLYCRNTFLFFFTRRLSPNLFSNDTTLRGDIFVIRIAITLSGINIQHSTFCDINTHTGMQNRHKCFTLFQV